MNLFSTVQQGHPMFQKALHGTTVQFCDKELLFSCAADDAQLSKQDGQCSDVQPKNVCAVLMVTFTTTCYIFPNVHTPFHMWPRGLSKQVDMINGMIQVYSQDPYGSLYYSCKNRQLSQKNE